MDDDVIAVPPASRADRVAELERRQLALKRRQREECAKLVEALKKKGVGSVRFSARSRFFGTRPA